MIRYLPLVYKSRAPKLVSISTWVCVCVEPEQVKFVTRIYHPNVKTDSGEICSDILNENWGPTLNVTYVLNTIRQASQPHRYHAIPCRTIPYHINP